MNKNYPPLFFLLVCRPDFLVMICSDAKDGETEEVASNRVSTNGPPIDALPFEMMCSVFSYVDLRTLTRCVPFVDRFFFSFVKLKDACLDWAHLDLKNSRLDCGSLRRLAEAARSSCVSLTYPCSPVEDPGRSGGVRPRLVGHGL